MNYKRILYFFCTTCRPNHSRTVRFAFPFVFGALAILGALAITTNEQTYIEVTPSQTKVRAGDRLSLDVYVNAHKPVNAIDIEIKVPKSQLKVTGIDTGESVITLWTQDPYFEGDTVYLRGGTFRKGFLGKHLIANINVQAVNTGVAYVDVADSLLLAGDGNATEIAAKDIGTEQATLYIANADGTFQTVGLEGGGSTLEGSATVMILTDIDGDGDVSLQDVSRFMAAWKSGSAIFDFNGDGRMTFTDFAIILADSFFH